MRKRETVIPRTINDQESSMLTDFRKEKFNAGGSYRRNFKIARGYPGRKEKRNNERVD